MMARIVIVYEHKAREMETALLLAFELRKRGHLVNFFFTNELKRFKYLFKKPDLVVTPFLYGDYELKRYVYSVFGKVKKICNLQWEQVYNGSSKNDNKRTPKDLAKKAVHICWGNKSYERLKKNGCNNAVLTGAPHMDFLKKRFKGWYGDRELLFKQYNIDSSYKTLLFISSFSYLGLSDERLDEIKARADFDPYFFRDLTIQSRKEILDWFERRLKTEKETNIVYRPHPGEYIDDRIKKIEKEYNNFYIISDCSVKQWITTCDIILNWYSTAGVEAFFAQKSNLFLRPIHFPEHLEFEMFEEVCVAKTYDEFFYYTDDYSQIDDYYTKNPLDKKISQYYLTDDSYSYQRIITTIEEMLCTDKYDFVTDEIVMGLRLLDHLKSFLKYIVYCGWKKNWKVFKMFIYSSERLHRFIQYQEILELDKISINEQEEVLEKLKRIVGHRKN